VVAGKRRFGNIRRRASGRYQVRYAGPDGLTHNAPRTFATEEEAEDWLIVTEADIIRGDWWNPDVGRVPFGPYAGRWIEERQLAARTRDKYERHLRVHVGPTFKATDLVDITPGRVRSWRQSLLAKGAGRPTVAGAYRFMRAVLNTAVDDELIRKNPCRIKGADQDNSPERPTVTIGEVYAIADAIKPWWRALVLMAAFSSLRWGELIALRRRHLDLDQGLVTVKAKLAEVGGQFETGIPKSNAGVRVVAIPLAIVPDVVAHLAEWSEAGANGRVFVGPRGATPKRSNFNRYWQQAVNGAGIEADPEVGLHVHDLRHVGNDLRSPGASIRDLMVHMGHSTHNAALVYQHADVQRQREMAAKLSEAIERAIWPTSGPGRASAVRKAKRPARPQGL
jgi:integrase